jgi:hypothetical protein
MQKKLLTYIAISTLMFIASTTINAFSFGSKTNWNPSVNSNTVVDEDDNGEGLEIVVQAIRDALQESQNAKVEGFNLGLTNVKVELNTVVTGKLGGKIKFLIFSFGKTKTKENSSTITLSLSVPKPAGAPQAVDTATLRKALAKAIVEAKESYKVASKIDPRLTSGTVSLSFKFVVKDETGGGGGVPSINIIPIGLEGSGEYSKAQVHTITLTFS